MDIEGRSVADVISMISSSDYLEPHINMKDREPSWDGDVEVYSTRGDNHSKENLIRRVPVQVKGQKAPRLNTNMLKFSVECADMRNFLEEGGAIFFVVQILDDGSDSRIFYYEFLPFDLKNILRRGKGQKTKTIEMRLFPKNKNDIDSLFLAFANNMIKQAPSIHFDKDALAEIVESGLRPELSICFPYVSQSDLLPIDLLFKNNVYVYLKSPLGIELPIKHFNNVTEAEMAVFIPITVNEKIYYDKCRIVRTKDAREVRIGKSIKISGIEENSASKKFEFALSGTLSERIQDEKFIIAVLSEKQFEMNGVPFSLDKMTDEEFASFNFQRQKDNLTHLQSIKETLDVLDVNQDLDYTNLTKQDFADLQNLRKAVINKEPITLENKQSAYGFMSISNLNIMIVALKRRDGKFDIYNYNDMSIPVTVKTAENQEHVTSFYVQLSCDDVLKCCNLNFAKMLDGIKKVHFSEFYLNQIINLILEFLRAFDKSDGKRKDILDAAIGLSKWIKESGMNNQKKYVSVINYYQAIRRKRALEVVESKELLQIAEDSQQPEEARVGAYLLLDNQLAASIHFENLEEMAKENFRKYPIFRFWKDGKEAL